MQTPSELETGSAAYRLPLIGFLLVQLLVGYEWLMSGVTKLYRGGFPSGLADELTEKSEDVHGWYKSFLDGTVIQHGPTFGYLIEFGELLVGAGLIVAAIVWLFRWERLPDRGRIAVLATAAIASFGGIFMAVNFHLANAAPHPWLIARDGFDEGIDLDSLLPAIQVVTLVVSVGLIVSLRRTARVLTVRSRAQLRSSAQGER